MENQKEENAVNTEVPTPTISMGDISFALQVLKIAARRGAFELNEMKNVGELGERFQRFLDATAPPATKEDDETQQKDDTPGDVVAEGAD